MKAKTSTRRSPKRRSAKKQQYRIRNWKEYNHALKQRGSLTVWVDEQALAGWRNQHKSGKPGASHTYTNSAIACALTVQNVYHLALRATQGFLTSVFTLLQVELPVPHYSTLSRRRQTLTITLQSQSQSQSQNQNQNQNQNLHLVVDSTGFKVYGEGEWKVRQHGWSKRRTWRKLHLGLDEATGQVVAALVTTNQKSDKEMLPGLLQQVEQEIKQVSADGAYDYVECYAAIAKREAAAAIPPRRNAQLHPQDSYWKDTRWQARNRNLERIRELQGCKPKDNKDKEWGRKQWKQESGYHRRSLAETAVFRLKTIFGERLSARELPGQDTELLLRCAALNKMTGLGLPQSYPI